MRVTRYFKTGMRVFKAKWGRDSGLKVCAGWVACATKLGTSDSFQTSDYGPYDPTKVTSIKTSLDNRLRILSNNFAMLSKVAQLLKKGGFMLELKRRGYPRVQMELAEFIALQFPSSKNLNFVISHRRS